jgi:predicted component of type VI protein secretion system
VNVISRFERTLEGLVNNTFARLFRSEVKPVELRSALARELDNNAQVLSRTSSLAPNAFIVELSPSDHERLASYGTTLEDDLAQAVEDHANLEHYHLPGRARVRLEAADDLSTGRFRVRSRAESGRPAGGAEPGRDAPRPDAVKRPGDGPGPQPASQPTVTFPAQSRVSPWLEVSGRTVDMPPPGLLIGRGTEADLQVNDPGVSRRHAEIRVAFIGRRFTVTLHDLGSTNGTSVGGQRTSFATLDDGSVITIGGTDITVRIPAAVPADG